MAAHLFIFYFGLLSFLTPPVAIASYVAAGLANSGMWETSWEGMKLATVAYLLPFLWCYNPALILDGSALEIAYAVGTALVAAFMIARGLQGRTRRDWTGRAVGAGLFLGSIVVGGSTVWFGSASLVNVPVAAAGLAVLFAVNAWRARQTPAAAVKPA
jgi:TRAP-type uncharacterized transport system fused permease subunit